MALSLSFSRGSYLEKLFTPDLYALREAPLVLNLLSEGLSDLEVSFSSGIDFWPLSLSSSLSRARAISLSLSLSLSLASSHSLEWEVHDLRKSLTPRVSDMYALRESLLVLNLLSEGLLDQEAEARNPKPETRQVCCPSSDIDP
jgi:hypothetical protein